MKIPPHAPLLAVWLVAVFALVATVQANVPVTRARTTAGTAFADDVAFLRKHTEIIVLSDSSETRQVAIAPAWQGRVMTSTVNAADGAGHGWINRELIASGKLMPQINAYGGEDRFWLGPEGSQYSIYFSPGAKFEGANWSVPPPLDTMPYRAVRRSRDRAIFEAEFTLTNRAGTTFQVAVGREIRLLDLPVAWRHLGLPATDRVALVAYESENRITNIGSEPWKRETGLLSIWILGMFNASPSATMVIPMKTEATFERGAGVTVYPAYGEIPSERLKITRNAVFFRGDAQRRGKIGVNPQRSLGKLASYDAERRVLTVVQFSQAPDASDYVNSNWGDYVDPYAGDPINCYNDGPSAPGADGFGPFYELESSSPAAELIPGSSITHTHRTVHIVGADAELETISQAILGVPLAEIKEALPVR